MLQLPSDFVQQMISLLGEEEYNNFLQAIQEERITSIRTNPHKISTSFSGLEQVPWSRNGYYLSERPIFTMDPLFHAGCYYAQEASSMFVEQAILQHWDKLDSSEPLFLDLCAAPGGKSTLLATLLNGKGWLVCNEVMKSRIGVLDENITKWGVPNVTVTNSDPKEFGQLNGLFDLILIDAPCSGEGMFRKDDKAIEDWSIDNVKLCSERQKRIVADVFPALKEGGLLIYSTCTYNAEEDEKNVQWIADQLGANILEIQTNKEWNITSSGIGYHFFPHKTKGEGFYLAILQKTAEEETVRIKTPKQLPVATKATSESCKKWLTATDNLYLMEKDKVVVYPSDWADTALFLKQNLHVIHNGLTLGTVKGKDIVPDTTLALSWLLNAEEFSTYNCSWEEAIQFLKKENLTLSGVEKGFVLFCFKGTPLGFGKNIGNRCNNLYPSEWHIRMESALDKYSEIL